MSLPAKLLFNNKINSSYARNFNSVIQPQNTSNYALGQTAIFNIPCMRNQVLSGADTLLALKLRIRNASGAANTAYLNKGGIAAAIQRLRIFSGSQLLCDIDNYGNLLSLLTSWQSSMEHSKGKLQQLQGTGDIKGLQLLNNAAAALVASPTLVPAPNPAIDGFDFCFPLLSILSLTDNYVPLWAMASNGSLRVEVQFVSTFTQFIGSITAVQASADGVNTVFNDCKIIPNFFELSDAAMQIIESSLEGKPVSWVCQSYSNYVFNATLGTVTTNISMPIPAKFNSLKALYITMRNYPDGALTFFSDEFSKFRLSQYTTRIGSRVIPADRTPNYSSTICW